VRARLDLIQMRAERQGRSDDASDAEIAARGFDRFGRVISDLLDASRISHGLFFIEEVETDLNALVAETCEFLSSADVPVHVHAKKNWRVVADPARLGQALENLVSNAVQHSPKAAPVEVTLSRAGEGSGVAISVTNQGPAIPPDLLPRLFSRFERGPESNGLGLGLFVARGIADAHGGTLEATSHPGAGTTFTLTLPAKVAGAVPDQE
jgi:two-component system, OmpR family, sensor kinase